VSAERRGHARLKNFGWDPYEGPRSPRRLLQLLGSSMAMLWEASPRLVLLFAVLQVLSSAALGYALLVVRNLVSDLLSATQSQAGFGSIVPQLAVLSGVVAFTALAGTVQNYLRMLLAEEVGWLADQRVLDVACAVELEAFDSTEFHDRLTRAQNAGGRPFMVTQSLLQLSGSLATLTGLVIVLLLLQPLLVLVLLVTVVPLFAAAGAFSEEYHLFALAFSAADRRRWYLRSLLTGREMAKEVRAFDLTGAFRGWMEEAFEEKQAEFTRLVRRSIPRTLLAGGATAVAIGGTIGLLIWFVLTGRMPLASATAAAVAIVQLAQILSQLAFSVSQIYESSLFLADHRAFCTMLPEIRRLRPGRPAPPGFEEVRLEHVTFAYPDSTVRALDDVSLSFRSGEIVAVVGENGSGKTTLAKLLCLLYRPQSGRILWDACDLSDVDAIALRRRMAVLFQDFSQYLFPVALNIGVGRVEVSEDRSGVVRASRQAGAHEFVERLPQDYDTPLGMVFEEGADLSVGQWQRIALARAFFRDAPFIILDEPTAALDARAENQLFESIRGLFSGRTVLLISHRFSSVRSADRIFVLKAGRLHEQGTHEELMRLGGHYAELFKLQAAAYLASEPV
jgi:ATP-binding cassette subfamily B protein